MHHYLVAKFDEIKQTFTRYSHDSIKLLYSKIVQRVVNAQLRSSFGIVLISVAGTCPFKLLLEWPEDKF